jgi:hypothetical protein
MNAASPRLWFLSPLETFGSIRFGFATGLALWSLGAVVLFVAGDRASPLGLRFAAMFPLYIGYSLAFAPVVLARLILDVHELAGIDRFSVPVQIAVLTLSVAIHLLMATLTPTGPEGAFQPLLWLARFESLLLWVVVVPIIIVFLRAIYRLRHLGRAARPNLLEDTPLAPFGRAGTALALYFGGMVALGSFVTLAISVGGSERVDLGQAPVVSRTLFTLLLLAAVYLPLSGARLAIRDAKLSELTRIAAKVGHHSEVLDTQDGPERASGVMAYRERIQGVSEWPFSVGTAPRAILYIALPFLSWIAAALVERVLGAFLE